MVLSHGQAQPSADNSSLIFFLLFLFVSMAACILYIRAIFEEETDFILSQELLTAKTDHKLFDVGVRDHLGSLIRYGK